jgi:hypothetical protein
MRVGGLLARAWPLVGRVCGFVLIIVAGATIASLLATAALGLVGFVPFFWFAVVPLQLLAWVLRALVFQYITVGAVAVYASIYRLTGPQTRPLWGLEPELGDGTRDDGPPRSGAQSAPLETDTSRRLSGIPGGEPLASVARAAAAPDRGAVPEAP